MAYNSVKHFTHWISPEEINYRLLPSEVTRNDTDIGKFPLTYKGLVLDGDWDLQREPYTNEPRYQSFKSHFVDGVPLKETNYGKQIVDNRNTPEEYFNYVQDLYDSLSKKGYDENKTGIAVNVGRDGELIFNNNQRHRLALSKIIGLDKIPVDIIVWHDEYWN